MFCLFILLIFLALILIWDNPDFPAMIASVAGEHRDEHAAWFDPYTAELCTGELEIRFHAVCGHWESDGATGERRWVETHTVDALWGPKGLGPEAYGFPADPEEAKETMCFLNPSWNGIFLTSNLFLTFF